jgi:hypothetical protein
MAYHCQRVLDLGAFTVELLWDRYCDDAVTEIK